MKYEVRCCCVPQKLVGWLDWPDDSRTEITFPLLEPMPTFVPSHADASRAAYETVLLKLDYYAVDGRRYEAVKAEGVPIEKLRRVRGFVENTAAAGELPWGTGETGTGGIR